MGVGTRRQMHADTAGAPHRDCGIGHFQHQPCAILRRATVGIGALVGAVLQELIEQVAIRAMDFHAVETSLLGVLRPLAVGLDDARDFIGFQGARRFVILHRANQADMAGRFDGAGCDRQLAIEIDWVGDAAYVPEL